MQKHNPFVVYCKLFMTFNVELLLIDGRFVCQIASFITFNIFTTVLKPISPASVGRGAVSAFLLESFFQRLDQNRSRNYFFSLRQSGLFSLVGKKMSLEN